ncbi:MAG: class I tRNA ligase family protein [Pseudomonadota bacterium]
MNIITATPPTPNGDLHVGHLSGPYLNADVAARFLRLNKEPVMFVTGSDANQAYVLSSAEKRGQAPEQMVQECSAQIQNSLNLAKVSYDAFVVPDERHRKVVQEFYLDLYRQGLLKIKSLPSLWSEKQCRYCDYSFVTGFCPNCFAKTAESVCEACAHPVRPDTIIDPRSSADESDRLVLRNREALVLELEPHRHLLEEYYRDHRHTWRPNIIRLVEQIMAKRLPDFAVTSISSWGIPAPFPGYDGHVLTGWAELLPGFMRAVEDVSDARSGISFWEDKENVKLYQFLGVDNGYFFAIPHIIISLIRKTPLLVPECIITNEFYELNDFKFSTSLNNVVWIRDIIQSYSSDEIRLYLAYTNPELQTCNFVNTSFERFAKLTFSEKWRQIGKGLNRLITSNDIEGATVGGLTECHRSAIDTLNTHLSERFHPTTIGLRDAAALILNFTDWYAQEIAECKTSTDRERIVSLWGVLEAVAVSVSPIMPVFGASLLPSNVDLGDLHWGHVPDRPRCYYPLFRHQEQLLGAA